LFNRLKSKVFREIQNRYRKNVPLQKQVAFIKKNSNWYEPVLAGPSTFIHDATSAETVKGVVEIIQKLDVDNYLKYCIEFYKAGLERFGKNWRYADINTVLYGISKNIKVESYLEIGVRRGRSMSIVAAMHPEVNIVGFDMWIQDYAGMENPGPVFVQRELEKVGYMREAVFISGNSRHTIPEYFRKNSDEYFDVITVDGDHSAKGAKIDLVNVIPRIKIGGLLIFDDICNPYHLDLKKVWEKTIKNKNRFSTYSFEESGYGIAFGIKRY
jgi:predicted O-methyltransferase YrrM